LHALRNVVEFTTVVRTLLTHRAHPPCWMKLSRNAPLIAMLCGGLPLFASAHSTAPISHDVIVEHSSAQHSAAQLLLHESLLNSIPRSDLANSRMPVNGGEFVSAFNSDGLTGGSKPIVPDDGVSAMLLGSALAGLSILRRCLRR
jgi:hypothetical protein